MLRIVILVKMQTRSADLFSAVAGGFITSRGLWTSLTM